jgi:hypothetical protein
MELVTGPGPTIAVFTITLALSNAIIGSSQMTTQP